MEISRQNSWVPAFITLSVIALCSFLTFSMDMWYVYALPIVPVILYLSFYKTSALWLSLYFLTPLSINLADFSPVDFGFYVPTEPLLLGLLGILFLTNLKENKIYKKVLLHPISIGIYIYLGWMFITCFTSTHPLVSFKFFLVKTWFIFPIYFFGIVVFKNLKNIKRSLWLYIIGLSLVMTYTLIRHASYGFAHEPGHWVMEPFFKDHTSYGAVLAMYFPVLVGLVWDKEIKGLQKSGVIALLGLLTAAVIFSYTRAAWVSIIGAGGIYLLVVYKIKLKYLIPITLVASAALILSWDKIMMDLERNNTDSSDDFAEHVTSASNISTDASNLERLNRWNAAISMFKEKPVFGYGPGTYMFEYAPHQKPEDKTIISTNFGTMGNAHSEYLGPLAESGLFGMLSVLLLIAILFYKSIRIYYKVEDKQLRNIVMYLMLGLSTYFIHGVLNNYLDTDKASVPVWSFMAAIVSIEIFHSSSKKKEQIELD